MWRIKEKDFSAIKTSTVTLCPRRGNGTHLKTIRPHFLGDWVENAVGWRNRGIDWWCQKVGNFADPSLAPLIVSIGAEAGQHSVGELYALASKLRPYWQKIAGVEINFACPNINQGYTVLEIQSGCHAVKQMLPELPLMVSLGSTGANGLEQILPALEKEQVEAISLNTFPWRKVFPTRLSRFHRYGGGAVSGLIVQQRHWALASQIQELSRIPVIWPGVRSYSDLETAQFLGARAISFSSLFLTRPGRPNGIIRRYRRDQLSETIL